MPTTEPLTRERVLEEAAKLFAERGYAHTRLKDIAERFGVTHAALYYHFARKEDILIQLNQEAIDGLLSMAGAVAESPDIPDHEKFDHVLHGHVRYVASNVLKIASLFDGEYALPSEFARQLRRQRRQYTNTIIEMFRVGQDSGRFREGDANMLVSLVIGAATWIYRWYRPGGDWSPEQLADDTVRLLASGYLRAGVDSASPNGSAPRPATNRKTRAPEMLL